MIGKAKVKISIWEDETHTYCIDDEIEIMATADVEDDERGSYYVNVEPYYSEEDIDCEVADYVRDKYTYHDFEWYIDEESFEVEL